MNKVEAEWINDKKSNKKALVIAISEYDSPGLKSIEFCKNDGQEMSYVLKGLGYDIPDHRRLIGHVNYQILKDAVYDFFTDEYNRPDDTLLFYYSGHGVPDKWGTPYLAPSDIDSDRPFITGFSFDDLTNSMLECNSLSVVTILDSCYSGSLKISKGLDAKGGEEGTTRIANKMIEQKSDKLQQGIGRCLLASSQGYEEAYDRQEKDHSIFTYYLLEGLKGNKDAVDDEGNVTYETLGKFITREFGNLSPSKRPKQTPIRKGEVSGGEIILANYPEFKKIKEDYYSLLGKGENFYRENKYQEALECYNAILRSRPEDQFALLRKGHILLSSNQNKKALECFNYVINLNDSNPEAWYYKAQLYLKIKDYETANKCLQEATDLSPNDERIWESFKKVKSLLKSSRQLEKNTITQPDQMPVQNSLEKEQSVTDFVSVNDNFQLNESNKINEKAVEDDPNKLVTLIREGNTLYNQGKYKESIPYFDAALQIDPQNEDVLYDKFKALEHLPKEKKDSISKDQIGKVTGDIKTSNNVEKNVLEIEPKLAKDLVNKGLDFYRQGKYEEAIELYDKALAIENNKVSALNNKALALHDQGKYEEAIELYDKALAIDPNCEIFKENKRLALKDLSNEKAIKTFKIYPNPKIQARELSEELVSYLQHRDYKVTFRPDHQYNTYYIQANKTGKIRRIVGISESVSITLRGISANLEIALSTGEFKKNLLSQVAISAPLLSLSTVTFGIPTVAAVGTTYYVRKRFKDDLWEFIESKIL